MIKSELKIVLDYLEVKISVSNRSALVQNWSLLNIPFIGSGRYTLRTGTSLICERSKDPNKHLEAIKIW